MYNDPAISGRLDPATLERMADLPVDEQIRIARVLGPRGLHEAMRIYANMRATAGLGKNIFEKIGSFLGRATNEVGKAVGSVVGPVLSSAVPQTSPQPAPVVVQNQTPSWVVPAAIGGGVLLLVLMLRK